MSKRKKPSPSPAAGHQQEQQQAPWKPLLHGGLPGGETNTSNVSPVPRRKGGSFLDSGASESPTTATSGPGSSPRMNSRIMVSGGSLSISGGPPCMNSEPNSPTFTGSNTAIDVRREAKAKLNETGQKQVLPRAHHVAPLGPLSSSRSSVTVTGGELGEGSSGGQEAKTKQKTKTLVKSSSTSAIGTASSGPASGPSKKKPNATALSPHAQSARTARPLPLIPIAPLPSVEKQPSTSRASNEKDPKPKNLPHNLVPTISPRPSIVTDGNPGSALAPEKRTKLTINMGAPTKEPLQRTPVASTKTSVRKLAEGASAKSTPKASSIKQKPMPARKLEIAVPSDAPSMVGGRTKSALKDTSKKTTSALKRVAGTSSEKSGEGPHTKKGLHFATSVDIVLPTPKRGNESATSSTTLATSSAKSAPVDAAHEKAMQEQFALREKQSQIRRTMAVASVSKALRPLLQADIAELVSSTSMSESGKFSLSGNESVGSDGKKGKTYVEAMKTPSVECLLSRMRQCAREVRLDSMTVTRIVAGGEGKEAPPPPGLMLLKSPADASSGEAVEIKGVTLRTSAVDLYLVDQWMIELGDLQKVELEAATNSLHLFIIAPSLAITSEQEEDSITNKRGSAGSSTGILRKSSANSLLGGSLGVGEAPGRNSVVIQHSLSHAKRVDEYIAAVSRTDKKASLLEESASKQQLKASPPASIGSDKGNTSLTGPPELTTQQQAQQLPPFQVVKITLKSPKVKSIAMRLQMSRSLVNSLAIAKLAKVSPNRKIRLIHFSNVCQLEPVVRGSITVGGASRFMGRLAALKGGERQHGVSTAAFGGSNGPNSNNSPYLILCSGNVLGPSMMSLETKGRQMVEALGLIGVNYSTFGFHDFSYGLRSLKENVTGFSHNQFVFSGSTRAKWVCSNLKEKDGSGVAGALESDIFTWSGVRIGILGLCANFVSDCRAIAPGEIVYSDIVETGLRVSEALVAGGAEIVIALTHCDRNIDANLKANCPLIDIILGGHDRVYKFLRRSGILKSGADFDYLSEMSIEMPLAEPVEKPFSSPRTPNKGESQGFSGSDVRSPTSALNDTHAHTHTFGDDGVASGKRYVGRLALKLRVRAHPVLASQPPHDQMDHLIRAFALGTNSKLNVPIGRTVKLLDPRPSKTHKEEGQLTNFLANIMSDAVNADFAILTGGAVSGAHQIKGGLTFTFGDVVSWFPYDTKVMSLRLRGSQVIKLLETMVQNYSSGDNNKGGRGKMKSTRPLSRPNSDQSSVASSSLSSFGDDDSSPARRAGDGAGSGHASTGGTPSFPHVSKRLRLEINFLKNSSSSSSDPLGGSCNSDSRGDGWSRKPRIENVHVNGHPIDLNGSYTVALEDTVARGRGMYAFLLDDASTKVVVALDNAVHLPSWTTKFFTEKGQTNGGAVEALSAAGPVGVSPTKSDETPTQIPLAAGSTSGPRGATILGAASITEAPSSGFTLPVGVKTTNLKSFRPMEFSQKLGIKKLSHIYGICNRLTQTETFDDLARQLSTVLKATIQCEGVRLLFLDEAAQQLRSADSEKEQNIDFKLSDFSLPSHALREQEVLHITPEMCNQNQKGGGVPPQVRCHRDPKLHHGATAESDKSNLLHTLSPLCSSLTIPVMYRGQARGVIQLFNKMIPQGKNSKKDEPGQEEEEDEEEEDFGAGGEDHGGSPTTHDLETMTMSSSNNSANGNSLKPPVVKTSGGGFTEEEIGIALLLVKQVSVHTHFISGVKSVAKTESATRALLTMTIELNVAAREEGVNKMMVKIADCAKRLLSTDRASLFLVDKQEMYTVVPTKDCTSEVEIRLPVGAGIVGKCAETLKVINVHDAYKSPYFNPDVDKRTGYRTKTILCYPLLEDTTKECAGTLQFINKEDGTVFTKEDTKLVAQFCKLAMAALKNCSHMERLRKKDPSGGVGHGLQVMPVLETNRVDLKHGWYTVRQKLKHVISREFKRQLEAQSERGVGGGSSGADSPAANLIHKSSFVLPPKAIHGSGKVTASSALTKNISGLLDIIPADSPTTGDLEDDDDGPELDPEFEISCHVATGGLLSRMTSSLHSPSHNRKKMTEQKGAHDNSSSSVSHIILGSGTYED